MFCHKGIGAFIKRNREEEDGVDNIAENGGSTWCNPPLRILPQIIEDGNIENLSNQITGETCQRNTRDEYINRPNAVKADKMPVLEHHRN